MHIPRRRNRITAAAAVLLLAGAVIWFGVVKGARACSKAGCVSSATFDTSSIDSSIRRDAQLLTLCVNGACSTTNLTSTTPDFVQTTLRERDVRSATVTLIDAAGKELLHTELAGEHQAGEFAPNGPDCEPVCWQLALVIIDGALTTR